MQAEVEMVEDSRMITSGGDYSTFINEGVMKMRQPGKMMGITRYGNNMVINNNIIDMTSVDEPSWATTVLDPEDHFVCAFYEPLNPTHQDMPEMVNNGTINIKIEGTANTHPRTQAYGMFYDIMGPSHKVVNVINRGSINVSQSGPQHFNIAELGIVTRDNMMTLASGSIKVISWKTPLRDFSQTRDLFLVRGGDIDFAGGKLQMDKADGYVYGTSYSVAPESLIYNVGQDGFTYSYSGYSDLTFEAANPDKHSIDWDIESKTVSLINK